MSSEGRSGGAPGRAQSGSEVGIEPAEQVLAEKVRGLLKELRPALEELADDPGE